MSITFKEFEVAMETYGAQRLEDQDGYEWNVKVPAYQIAGVTYVHSGSNYVRYQSDSPIEIMLALAKVESGEKEPGEEDFWEREIHSVRGLLTFVTMVDEKYSKNFVDDLMNTIYKKLLDNPEFKKNNSVVFRNLKTNNAYELYNLLSDFSRIINPYADIFVETKEPIDYIDNTKLGIAVEDRFVQFWLTNTPCQVTFKNGNDGWMYDATATIDRKYYKGVLCIGHYYNNGTDGRPVDEVVRLDYIERNNEESEMSEEDIDLRISLKTGLAWSEKQSIKEAKPVTEDQVEEIIAHLKVLIKKVQKRIYKPMIK